MYLCTKYTKQVLKRLLFYEFKYWFLSFILMKIRLINDYLSHGKKIIIIIKSRVTFITNE